MPPIQITGTLFNHSIPAIIHSERAGIRTPDNLIKSQVLYQLSYTPLFNYIPFNYKENAQSRNRTSDTRIFSPLLYQLSYLGLYTIYLCKLREQDLNLRPSGYEPDELPDCSTPRYSFLKSKADDRTRTDNLLITNQLLCQLSHIGECLTANGWRWIRTTEAICSRFTVCPLWPLGNPSLFF